MWYTDISPIFFKYFVFVIDPWSWNHKLENKTLRSKQQLILLLSTRSSSIWINVVVFYKILLAFVDTSNFILYTLQAWISTEWLSGKLTILHNNNNKVCMIYVPWYKIQIGLRWWYASFFKGLKRRIYIIHE